MLSLRSASQPTRPLTFRRRRRPARPCLQLRLHLQLLSSLVVYVVGLSMMGLHQDGSPATALISRKLVLGRDQPLWVPKLRLLRKVLLFCRMRWRGSVNMGRPATVLHPADAKR